MNNKGNPVYLICSLPTSYYSCLVCNICLCSSPISRRSDDTGTQTPVFEMNRRYPYRIQFSRRNTVKRLNRVWNIDFTTHKVWIHPVLCPPPGIIRGLCYGTFGFMASSHIFLAGRRGNPDLVLPGR